MNELERLSCAVSGYAVPFFEAAPFLSVHGNLRTIYMGFSLPVFLVRKSQTKEDFLWE